MRAAFHAKRETFDRLIDQLTGEYVSVDIGQVEFSVPVAVADDEPATHRMKVGETSGGRDQS